MSVLIGLAGFGLALAGGNLYTIAFCAACLAINVAFTIAAR